MCPRKNCENELMNVNCKLICEDHGVVADCSDPFYL